MKTDEPDSPQNDSEPLPESRTAPKRQKVPGSGRKSGSRNVASPEAKQEARQALNANGARVIRRAVHVALGLKIKVGKVWQAPSEQFQAAAMKILANKLLPDLSAQALQAQVHATADVSDEQLAVWVARMMSEASYRDDDDNVIEHERHDPIPSRVHKPAADPIKVAPVLSGERAVIEQPKVDEREQKLNRDIDQRIIDMGPRRPQVRLDYNSVRGRR